MHTATRKIRFAVPLFIAVSAILLTVSPASSGGDGTGVFTLDHYWVYGVTPTLRDDVDPIVLEDQFGETTNSIVELEFFAVPVNKNSEGILDPVTHYTWWRLDGDLPFVDKDVVVRNQFGEETIRVSLLHYLMAPAKKLEPFTGGEADTSRDHYKCYKVEGNRVGRPVLLRDQFGEDSALVEAPAYLCNPTKKTLPSGQVFPIHNPLEHLVCYTILTGPVGGITVFSQDQFANTGFVLIDRRLLCVPSLKDEVVQIEESSWGDVKSIYR